MLGNPAKMVPSITPVIPRVGIRRKARGSPIDIVNRLSFISIFVSPRPTKRLLMLMRPKTTNKLFIAYSVRKRGA